jgi:hypothetical protein
MNPRRLDGGSQELGELIRHSLQGTFPGIEFFLEPLDQTEFGVYWKYKAPGAPSEKDVRVHMALNWPSIDAKLRDSDVQAIAGRTGGATGVASILQSLKPKNKSLKTCPHCGKDCRRSARACVHCGAPFPTCYVCGGMLYADEKYCGKCGVEYHSRPLPVPVPALTPDSLSPDARRLFDAITLIDNEQSAREFFDAEAAQIQRAKDAGTF